MVYLPRESYFRICIELLVILTITHLNGRFVILIALVYCQTYGPVHEIGTRPER